jgi:ketosteroid isomerase-like protein
MDVQDGRLDLPDGVIGKARDAFVGALESGDAKAASASYTSDARLLAPSAELFRGREAIEQFWRAGLDTGISEVELETLELVRLNGLAYEIGRYALRLKPIEGIPVVDRGKYVRVHEEQTDGSWMWALEMFNPEAISARTRATTTQGGTK